MNIRIENLANHMKYMTTIVDWLHSEWGNNNYKYWDSWVRSSLSLTDVPCTFIVLVEGELAGTYSLWRCDLQSCQDLFPWFGGLYVSEQFRGKTFNGQKLGVIMQQHAIQMLRHLNYSEVYLFTEKSPAYYNRNGWETLYQTFDELDNVVTVCKYSISCN